MFEVVVRMFTGLGRLLTALAQLCERLECGLDALCTLCRWARTAGAWAAQACAGVDAACSRWARAAAPLLLGYAWLCERVGTAVGPAVAPPRSLTLTAPTRPKGM